MEFLLISDMESALMDVDSHKQVVVDPLSFARSYQVEAFEQAIRKNTLVYLETGSGKTMISIMLLRSYSHLIRKPSPFFAVFLVPQVVLVTQQAKAIQMNSDLKVGKYWGDMGVDFWDAAMWRRQINENEVLVMTPAILLNCLSHSFFQLSMIKVLVFDECHHARGKHAYASIMNDFYHRELKSGSEKLPRILGMTASLLKSKGAASPEEYWKAISDLETLMNSKVYTCESESVLAEFIPCSTPLFKFFKDTEIRDALYDHIIKQLGILEQKYKSELVKLNLKKSEEELLKKKVGKLHSTFVYCLDELGVWLALKAAESLSSSQSDYFSWNKLDVHGEVVSKRFCSDVSKLLAACVPTDPDWSISNIQSNVRRGFLTKKISSLIESLFEYRELTDIRCIIFVERVISAIVLQSLLSELLPKINGWKTKHIAGNNSGLQSQTRKLQNEIVEEFRKGLVNIIVATSILEEGLDVQSCNLVVRFDPSATVCSFIQSRGRARKQNSVYLSLVNIEDISTHNRLQKYLVSGEIMRKESLRHASDPCFSYKDDFDDEECLTVESTGAIITLSSSVNLLYFYCSRLPSDGYFKPAPLCVVEEDMETFTLLLPKSCPIQHISMKGNLSGIKNIKTIKQKACLEACKQLYEVGALTDNLVPDIMIEEKVAQEIGSEPYNDEQPRYVPFEMVNVGQNDCNAVYYCYTIQLTKDFLNDVGIHDVVLALSCKLDDDVADSHFDLNVDRGSVTVALTYVGPINLDPSLVLKCRRFQIALFRALMDHNVNNLTKILCKYKLGDNLEIDYLLLPSSPGQTPMINWNTICSFICENSSVGFSSQNSWNTHNCPRKDTVWTKNSLVCTCMIENCLVYTPHNGHVYCITGILQDLNSNSALELTNEITTYKKYYKSRYGITLSHDQQKLVNGRRIFTLQNCLSACRQQKRKAHSKSSVELPPELCCILMSPITIATIYSFSILPSVMHRLESLISASNLKKILLGSCMHNVKIPTDKVLEAITTKKCQESFHLETLETLGDSFLKYAASQQLFKVNENNHEGLLTIKREQIISNAALRKLGCNHKLPGFIRNESFEPKSWMIPGDNTGNYVLTEEFVYNGVKIYASGTRKVKGKTVADVVEALIGVFLSIGGEQAGLLFMNFIGIAVDFNYIPSERSFQVQAEKLVNVQYLESLLKYSFNDRSLLVEALTHGSYMLPGIPSCYQRLEYLGDSVLDYLITLHFYEQYPGLTPGKLTDMRSASVNNDCYAQSAMKAELHKHILHTSHELYKKVIEAVKNFETLSLESTFGWESDSSLPKVLGDVIESLAGAILVDSGYNKEVVFRSIRPLLEPLITPDTVRVHPVKELMELCSKEHFPITISINPDKSVTVEIEAYGSKISHTSTADDKKTAKRLACKAALMSLKEQMLEERY
ncbi:hypothetical protein ACFE04_027005 [Oxalis oulophora]